MTDLKHLFLLIVSPGKTWQKMDKVPYATQIFLNQFLYSLMGITAIVSFLGHFFNDASLPRALQLAIVEFVKFFAGSCICNENFFDLHVGGFATRVSYKTFCRIHIGIVYVV